MRLRAALVPVALTVAAALIPGVAGAAVPTKKYDTKLVCGARGAKVWSAVYLAAENNCKQWLVLTWSEGESHEGVLNVAPGAHFNRGRWHAEYPITARLADEPDRCAPGGAFEIRKGAHGKQRPLTCN